MIDQTDIAVTSERWPLAALLAGNVVSLIGNALVIVALPWFVLQTTGSAAQAGLVGFARVLPAYIAGVFGGMVVDRFGYKSMAIVSDLVSGLAVAVGAAIEQLGFQLTLRILAVLGQLLGFSCLFVPAFRHLDAPHHDEVDACLTATRISVNALIRDCMTSTTYFAAPISREASSTVPR